MVNVEFQSQGLIEPVSLDAGIPFVEERITLPDLENSGESPISPERPRLKLTKVITISGPSFSGKDSVVKILNERHGWHVYDGSEDGFQRRREGSGNPIDRPKQEHDNFDSSQAEKFANLKTGNEMWIHQTRLGAIILAAKIDERNEKLKKQEWNMQGGSIPADKIDQIPADSILLWTSRRARETRAFNHAKYLAKQVGGSIPKKEKVLDEMRRKELDETKSWRKRYGTIEIVKNPYSRSLKTKNGRPVYKKYVLTDHLTPEQVANRIEDLILQLGAAEIISEKSSLDDSTGVGANLIQEGTNITLFENPTSNHGEPMSSQEPSAKIGVVSSTKKSDRTLEPA